MCGHGALALNSQEFKALNSEGYDGWARQGGQGELRGSRLLEAESLS